MKSLRLTVLLGLASLALTGVSAPASACLGDVQSARVYTVNVVPQLPPAATYAKWAPLLEQVGQKAGICFELIVPASISAFETVLWGGKTDFAFTNPYHEVVAKRRKGYEPLLIDSRVRLSGVLVTRADGGVRDVRDLQDKEVAFPSPNAFAASLLIRAELARQGIRLKPRYLQTHANVYRSVAAGEMVAGGGVNNTLQREEPGLRQVLKVLYETKAYAPHPFVVHPRVSRKVREQVANGFLGLAADANGRALLDAVQMPEPALADYRRDFAPLELLSLERWVVSNED